jgi:hypothetical protein
MDIEFSPGARGQRNVAAARNLDSLAPDEDWMNGKRLCSMDHPAIRGERAGRFLAERTMGVLWRHSSFNLVEPRPSHRPGQIFSGGCRRSDSG